MSLPGLGTGSGARLGPFLVPLGPGPGPLPIGSGTAPGTRPTNRGVYSSINLTMKIHTKIYQNYKKIVLTPLLNAYK